jgi:hypothetical protein
MRKVALALGLMAIGFGPLANSNFRKGQNVNLAGGGWVCRTLTKLLLRGL